MPLQAVCAKCSCKLRVKDELAAKTVRCPRCGWTFSLAQQPNGQAPAPQETLGDRSVRTAESTPAQSDEDWADEDLPDVPVLKRRRFSRGPVWRFLSAAQAQGTRLARRWSVWVVVGVVATVILVLQFGWDRLAGGTANSSQPIALQNAAASDESSENADASGPDKSSDAVPVTLVDSASEKGPAPLARVKEGSKAEPDKSRPGSKASGSLAARSSRAGQPRADAGERKDARSGPTQARQAGGGADVAMQRTDHLALPAHSGPYTPDAPPHEGEVLLARLKDGLHVCKVTSVDLEKRECDVTILESAAYNKRGEIKETKRSETARFGQLRAPHPPKHSSSKDPLPR
jgi:hypothetical protein